MTDTRVLDWQMKQSIARRVAYRPRSARVPAPAR